MDEQKMLFDPKDYGRPDAESLSLEAVRAALAKILHDLKAVEEVLPSHRRLNLTPHERLCVEKSREYAEQIGECLGKVQEQLHVTHVHALASQVAQKEPPF